MDGDK
jgi:hypothetical protein